MRIFGISDLHLSFSSNKPMDIFGDNWKNHAQTMEKNWDSLVLDDDVVLVPGDLSWAMNLSEAKADLDWIGKRPGLKILGRGNHDYWWSGIGKVRKALPKGCVALQNDAFDVGPFVIAGSRLWSSPGALDYKQSDQKIYEREQLRLRLSLEAAKKLAPNKPILAAVHYPPFTAKKPQTEFSKILEEYGVSICVYGHLHGKKSHETAVVGEIRGIKYLLISCDFLNFAPVQIWPKK
ncbi:metallophosphoesterase [Sulfobacillus acidophilus]|uniref:Metallophosphoesterase n=1 Tax=Sulfobacillus acidophilus TaxID=53633 RepID=A0ABS3AYH7_9FIRM|nr:metallophosphoesterase [Sulfobacillus acidophilus]